MYDLTYPHGLLQASYDQTPRWFCIANIDVEEDFRRQGIGKLLLRRSVSLAEEVGAQLIYAAIVSRESLDMMTSVFGEEAVKIRQVGSYAPHADNPEDKTGAMLWYELK